MLRRMKVSSQSPSRATTMGPLALLFAVVVIQLVIMGVRLEGFQGNCRGSSVSNEYSRGEDDSELREHMIVSNEVVSASAEVGECRFIPSKDLPVQDVYAGAWWQPVSRFVGVNITKIRNREDASFTPILRVEGGRVDARMPQDFLDFSVEHLSNWWKIAGTNAAIYSIGKLQAYTERVMSSDRVSDMMSSTIAVIPFGDKSTNQIWRQVRISGLTATIASLVRHGVGRVVVVGHFPDDSASSKQAFDLLYHYNLTIGKTELKFIHVDEDETVTSSHPRSHVNIPKEALRGLLQALKGEMNKAQEKDWLGHAAQKWKYIYFSEDDQILNARSIADIAHRTLDEGNILIPQRLLPIPHPLDLKGVVDDAEHQMLPETFSRVHVLDADTDSCCDTNERLSVLSGCGSYWFGCGFEHNRNRNHSRLESYELFRLVQGTGIVTLASTGSSRKCLPSKNKRGCVDTEASALAKQWNVLHF